MIIDAHSHWLPAKIIENAHFYHKSWGDIESQLEMMKASGIDRAVLTYPTSDAHIKLGSFNEAARIYNDSIAQIISRYPRRFIGAAILPVGNSKEVMDEFKRAMDSGFKAISLASSYNGIYLDEGMFLPIYKKAQQDNIPIFVHSQIVNPIGSERVEDPLLTPVIEYVFDTTICIGRLLMSGILREYDKVKFIFAHFGGVIPFLQHRFDATYSMLRSINFVKDLKGNPTDFLKRIYVDTSGDKTQSNFAASLELLGPGHILWGSDWPAKKDIAGSIQAVKDLQISAADKEDILGKNLEKIFS
ncbi:MAG: amidohydrolase family protein [Candidatus Omnitrophica bacterium]|nr:amidohydrolase family protein [Candidatus Omnitrophota bacterium]MDD5236440.1 amidohydrolase family protein [Candidatus Omnitrophota bacterium]MDD5610752.1 amidohydrolase family protein [Candidatus Omnitrophota bacterium]